MSESTCCTVCKKPLNDNTVRPGPTVGQMHKPCFDAWDAEQEALEHMYGAAFMLPPYQDGFDTDEDETLPIAA